MTNDNTRGTSGKIYPFQASREVCKLLDMCVEHSDQRADYTINHDLTNVNYLKMTRMCLDGLTWISTNQGELLKTIGKLSYNIIANSEYKMVPHCMMSLLMAVNSYRRVAVIKKLNLISENNSQYNRIQRIWNKIFTEVNDRIENKFKYDEHFLLTSLFTESMDLDYVEYLIKVGTEDDDNISESELYKEWL